MRMQRFHLTHPQLTLKFSTVHNWSIHRNFLWSMKSQEKHGSSWKCNKTIHKSLYELTLLQLFKHNPCETPSQGTIISPNFQEMKASHSFHRHEPHLQNTVVKQAEKTPLSPATERSSRFADTCHAEPSAFHGLSIRSDWYLSIHWPSWNLIMSKSSFDEP